VSCEEQYQQSVNAAASEHQTYCPIYCSLPKKLLDAFIVTRSVTRYAVASPSALRQPSCSVLDRLEPAHQIVGDVVLQRVDVVQSTGNRWLDNCLSILTRATDDRLVDTLQQLYTWSQLQCRTTTNDCRWLRPGVMCCFHADSRRQNWHRDMFTKSILVSYCCEPSHIAGIMARPADRALLPAQCHFGDISCLHHLLGYRIGVRDASVTDRLRHPIDFESLKSWTAKFQNFIIPVICILGFCFILWF